MPDALRSTTKTAAGELCAVIPLTTEMHKLPATCSALGNFCHISAMPSIRYTLVLCGNKWE